MKKLKLEDLRVGMYVEIGQLDEIYDTLIIVDEKSVDDTGGIIVFIGQKPCKESQEAMDKCTVIAPIYNDSIELNEDVIFDE